MNTKDVGEKSEAKILSALLDKNLTVLKPWGDNKRYDFVVEKDGVFYRIQCKTGRKDNEVINFCPRSVTTKNGKAVSVSYIGQIDFFMVYCPDTNSIYCLKVDECPIDKCYLRLSPTKNKQNKGIKMASDYEIDNSIFGR
jgi:PD-(D/E)XK endonuclease